MSGQVIGDAGDDGTELGFRIKAIQPGDVDQGVHYRGPLAAGIGTGEQPVLAAQSQRPDGPRRRARILHRGP